MIEKKTYTDIDRSHLSALNNSYEVQVDRFDPMERSNKYISTLEYVLRNGEFFQSLPFNFNTLVWVQKLIKAITEQSVKGNIYTNAMALCLSDSTNKINYIEGFTLFKGILVPHNPTPTDILKPHAWCELEGRIIDLEPTEYHTDVTGEAKPGITIGQFKKTSYFGTIIKKKLCKGKLFKTGRISPR